MNRDDLRAFLRQHRLCVQASVSPTGAPQVAVVGFAVSDDLEIVFDTLTTTRKLKNLRRNPRIGLVVGWDDQQTVQIEGLADEPVGEELERLKKVYFAVYPDGVDRQTWKDITWVRVVPRWARYSDFRTESTPIEVIKPLVDPDVTLEVCSDLRPILEHEVAAGNRVVETYRGWPGDVNVWLGSIFRTAHANLPAHLVLRTLDDPHYWPAEICCTLHNHFVMCSW